MARIISFQQYYRFEREYCPYTYIPVDGVVSINMETVQKLSSCKADYPQKTVKVQRSFLGRLFKGEYDIVDDESKPYYWLTFEYKNHRQDYESFLIDKEDYERLKVELARYGWHI